MEVLIILDWDDTVMCSSTILDCKPLPVHQQAEQLEAEKEELNAAASGPPTRPPPLNHLSKIWISNWNLKIHPDGFCVVCAGMQHAFKAALDTPLQSAIYTIQQLLHEQGALP